MVSRLPQSLRKFIRREKARIRRQFSDAIERERLINEIYQRFIKSYENKGDLQLSDK
jgi:hypothetical protein